MKVLSVFGTRPEAIKMAPVVRALRADERFQASVCVTGQHREMLDSVLSTFELLADFDLRLMKRDQSLNDIVSGVVAGLDPILARTKPDFVLVQGDTASCMAASLASFFRGIKIGHIEAGLRTGNLRSPWPEEANRRLTAIVTARHFAPTERAKAALISEGICESDVKVTGNTVVDALQFIGERVQKQGPTRTRLEGEFHWLSPDRRLILVTGHRRESFGQGFLKICTALRDIAARDDVEIVYPVHLNPNVREPVLQILGEVPRVHLIQPVDYVRFVYLMTRCSFILTDSGGIQEEAPPLRKPVLVMRDTSERMEAVEAGVAKLVTTEQETIVHNAFELLDNPATYASMASGISPFGDGHACRRILEDLVS
jgi:UDP-N-acetylglucosamine 2-epimerase (non-hydrolysing)